MQFEEGWDFFLLKREITFHNNNNNWSSSLVAKSSRSRDSISYPVGNRRKGGKIRIRKENAR
jgi:hypothetical protein